MKFLQRSGIDPNAGLAGSLAHLDQSALGLHQRVLDDVLAPLLAS